MKIDKHQFFTLKTPRVVIVAFLLVGLMGCSMWGGAASKPTPTELGVNTSVLGVRQVWMAQLGSRDAVQLTPHVSGTTITVASTEGVVAAIDARTGGDVWRLNLRETLSAGVGSDGRWTAVVSQGNELIVLEAGIEQWRQRLTTQVYTSPLVAGNRIFVLAADRSFMAFDASSGYRLWIQSRLGEPLVLRQPGVLLAVGGNLLAGISGRLARFNPDNGAMSWEVPLADPRGTNDVERLVELVGPVSRVAESVCARAFQAAIGCVDTARAVVKWTQVSNGIVGLDGDEVALYGVKSNGTVTAWGRNHGTLLWSSELLQYRSLTAPLLLGRSVIVGDESGLVHFLSREDGASLGRVATDESGVAVAPVVAADTLIVITRKGNVYGFSPD